MKPRQSDLKSFLNKCQRTSGVLESIEEPVLTWAVRREKVLSSFKSLIRKKREWAEKLPERWHTLTESQVAAGQVFIHPRRIRKFLRNFRDELGAEQVELLQHFMRNPWSYKVLVLEEAYEKEFFRVLDAETRNSLLIYSPAVSEISRSGARLYLTLLFHNGECYQTFGPLHYYRGFQPHDLEYFAKLLNPQFYRENGLSATIAFNPTPFLLLDTWTEFPAVAHKDAAVTICSDEVSLEDFDPQRYSEKLDINTKKEIIQCRLQGEDSPLRTGTVYYDKSKKRLFVRATNLDLYRKIRSIVAGDFLISEDPYWLASFNMYAAAKKILDKDIPVESYVRIFENDQEPSSPDEQEHLDRLNSLLAELSRLRGEGLGYSLEELAHKHGIELDTARQAEEFFSKIGSELNLEIEGGLEGYRPPPPVARGNFRLSPWANGIFVFLDSPRVKALFSSLQPQLKERFSIRETESFGGPPDSLEALPKWLEDLYFATQAQHDFTLLNTALHLLCSRGAVMEPVRDYAVEVLRLFWQVFLRSKDPQELESFIGTFARFCYEVLYRGGLAEIDLAVTKRTARKAQFRMRPSTFFRAWVNLTKEIKS